MTDFEDRWTIARAECKRLGGDLVSIPCYEANDAVRSRLKYLMQNYIKAELRKRKSSP